MKSAAKAELGCNKKGKMAIVHKLFSIEKNAVRINLKLFGIKIVIKRKFRPNKLIYKFPVQNNKIFFKSFSNTYSCNPRYILEEIQKEGLGVEFVWGVKDMQNSGSFPDNIKVVEYGSPEYIEEISSSKFIIRNDRSEDDLLLGLIKKPEQIYIQTWHGSLGIKKTGVDIEIAKNKAIKVHEIDASTIDYLTSNSNFTDMLFKNIFFNKGKILKIGHPRNDIFFRDNSDIKNKVYQKYNINDSVKIVMYAPTFRDKSSDLSVYSIDLESVKTAFERKFGGKWIVLTRLHPKLIALKEKYAQGLSESVIDVTSYPDMQELLCAVDAIITDYSSCIYDFMLTHKPGFIFATDIQKYNNLRGFYYPLESTPFPIAVNNEELIQNIETFDNQRYRQKVDEFLKEKGCIEDGHASEKVVSLIKDIMSGGK